MISSPICGARARSGLICMDPPEVGKKRCKSHGGAKGSGAPFGKRNGAYTQGGFTTSAIAERRWVRELIHEFINSRPD